MSAPVRRCWSCRQGIVRGRCPCSEPRSLAEARNGLLRGIRNALLISVVLYSGIGVGMLLVSSWGTR